MKKTKTIITSLLTVILCFSVFSIYPKAASFDYNVKTLSFTHGSVSISSGLGDQYGTSNIDIYNYLSFNFDKYYSGTVTLKWSYSSSAWRQNLTDWNILVIGGKIDSNNNTSGNIVFRVYDQDSFMVIMTYSNDQTLIGGTDPTFNFTSATSSLTAVINHNEEYNNIADIETELVSANTSLSAMVSMVNAIQGFSQNISTTISNLETLAELESDGTTNTDVERKLNDLSLLVVNMATNIANIRSDMEDTTNNISYLNSINGLLGDIENDVDGVEGLLTLIEGTLVVNGVSTIGTIATNMAAIAAALVPSGTETIYDLVSDIVDQFTDPNTGLIAELSALNTLITTTNSKLDDVKSTLNNILTAINGIDNQIDTISWISVNPENNIYWSNNLTADTSQYQSVTLANNTYKKIYLYIKGFPNSTEQIDKVDISLQNNSMWNSIKFTFIGYVYNGTLVRDSSTKIYSSYSKYRSQIYFYGDKPNTSSVYYVVEVDANNYYLILESTKYMSYLPSSDIEYWQLISYFNQYNSNKQIIENLLIDVNSETGIIQYNQDQQAIDIINNNFLTEFNLFKPYVNTTLQPLTSTTFTNEMSNQRTLFDYLFRNLFNLDFNTDDPSTVTNPIFLILIFGGILLALVG